MLAKNIESTRTSEQQPQKKKKSKKKLKRSASKTPNQNLLLDRRDLLKKFFPKEHLKYEIKLYEQSRKITPNQKYDVTRNLGGNFFLRQSYNKNERKNSEHSLETPREALLFEKTYWKNKFRGHFEEFSLLKKSNSTMYITKTPQKRLFHDKIEKLSSIAKEAEMQSSLIKFDIQSNTTTRERRSAKKATSQTTFNLNKVIEDLNLDKDRSDEVNQEKILNKNFNKAKKILDYRCKGYLKQIYNQMSYEDKRLNKEKDIKCFSIDYYKVLSKLKRGFREIAGETIKLKKELKGIKAIEPENPQKKMAKMIKNFNVKDCRNPFYLEELEEDKNTQRDIKPSFLVKQNICKKHIKEKNKYEDYFN